MTTTYIVSTARTPIGKFGGALKDVSPVDLGAHVMKAAVARAGDRPRRTRPLRLWQHPQARARPAGAAPRGHQGRHPGAGGRLRRGHALLVGHDEHDERRHRHPRRRGEPGAGRRHRVDVAGRLCAVTPRALGLQDADRRQPRAAAGRAAGRRLDRPDDRRTDGRRDRAAVRRIRHHPHRTGRGRLSLQHPRRCGDCRGQVRRPKSRPSRCRRSARRVVVDKDEGSAPTRRWKPSPACDRRFARTAC